MGNLCKTKEIFFVFVLVWIPFAQGQDFILTAPADTQYIPHYDPYRHSNFLPPRDLQTSDLPYHLQQTLPQYRYTTKPPLYDFQSQFPFQPSQPAPFRSQEPVVPSTHRPNYSHFFAHSRNPSQTETFLGEITLQNSENLQPKGKSYLNHRTRIFAPSDPAKKATLVKDYFVNNNGDVFISTRAPFIPKPTVPPKPLSTTERRNTFSPSNKKFTAVVPKPGLDLEPLLEEPIKDNTASSNNDDLVEVIKSKEDPGSYEYETSTTTDAREEDELDYQNYSAEEEEKTNDIPRDYSGEESKEVLPEEEEPTTVPPRVEEPQLVVSVVTTKSVINNTIIPEVTSTPTMSSTVDGNENSTDSWVVVASVQTSRSVSGARYLPSTDVKQDERIKLLNEDVTETTVWDETEAPTTVLPVKIKTSTESLTDKLDRVQSDLSSVLLSDDFKDNIAVINETIESTTTTKAPLVQIKKFSPLARPTTTKRPRKVFEKLKELPQGDQPRNATKITVPDVASFLPSGFKSYLKEDSNSLVADILRKAKTNFEKELTVKSTTEVDVVVPPTEIPVNETSTEEAPKITDDKPPERPKEHIFAEVIPVPDISSLLPPGYAPKNNDDLPKSVPVADITSLLPPGYVAGKTIPVENISSNLPTGHKKDELLAKAVPVEDISSLLPPGYKEEKTVPVKNMSILLPGDKKDDILAKAVPVNDISSLLPPGYKPEAKLVPVKDISSLLPPGYKPPADDTVTKTVPVFVSSTTKPPKPKGVEGLLADSKPLDVSAFLPPGYKGYKSRTTPKPLTTAMEKVPTSLLPPGFKSRSSNAPREFTPTSTSTTTGKPGFKIVFPSRPGGTRKSPNRLTTAKSNVVEEKSTVPSIQKGWPSRATTEFTGWPTPSTTPISIEKLLEAARAASSTSTTETNEDTTTSTSTTSTTTTTTTPKPTTPGICEQECDLAGTIKLIGGAKWAPELIDRNTKEWQILANEVQVQLEDVFERSNQLRKWYQKIRIDGFTEGSVLVDYLVELNDLGHQVNTLEIKKIFHESLVIPPVREAKSLNDTKDKLSLGRFVLDPKFTDFVVLPKQNYPTVGFAEDNVLLPQWAIAVIVIGLASLLFVIIFGVTVLVNRQKNAKKKAPIPLTEDMINELNKNHMGGIDNYGADDLYNMEDVWNDRGYDQKPPKKRSSGSIHDNSMSNLYDSWRSEWNGYYYNAYYGNPGSSQGGGRRRSDYDTNF